MRFIDHTFRRTETGTGLYYGWFEAMHTRLDLLLVGLDEDAATAAVGELRDEVVRIQKRLDRFDRQSDLWDINHSQSQEIYSTDEEMLGFFADALRYRDLTGGAFDIAIQTPGFNPATEYYYVDPENRALVFSTPGAVFDFGGYAKGYALEKMVEGLRAKGVGQGLVSFGNSSVYGIGSHPANPHWQVGVEHPLRTGDNMAFFELCDSALSSSGNNLRNRGHIKSPATGKEVANHKVISVAGASALDCEVLSTALFAAQTEQQRQAMLANFSLQRVLEMDYSDTSGKGFRATELLETEGT